MAKTSQRHKYVDIKLQMINNEDRNPERYEGRDDYYDENQD